MRVIETHMAAHRNELWNVRHPVPGQTVEPVFGQMKGTQEADEFRMRGQELCDGEWKFHAATHNLKKLHSRCVQLGGKGAKWLH